jgi:hypothetical protein
MLYVLMVTWIYPHQPPSSYTVEFSTLAACEQAKAAVYQQAAEIQKRYIDNINNSAKGLGNMRMAHLTALAGLPDATATCVSR